MVQHKISQLFGAVQHRQHTTNITIQNTNPYAPSPSLLRRVSLRTRTHSRGTPRLAWPHLRKTISSPGAYDSTLAISHISSSESGSRPLGTPSRRTSIPRCPPLLLLPPPP